MFSKLTLMVLLIFVVSFAFPPCGAGPTLVVNGTSAACTVGNNYFNTIQGAVDVACSNDTIIVCKDGTYDENIVVNVTNLTIRGNESYVPVTAFSDGESVFAILSNHVTIANFEMSGSSGGAGVSIFGNYTNISNNNIHNNRHGIFLQNSYFDTINNNFIDSISGDEASSGIYLYFSHNNSVSNNNVTNSLVGIYLESSTITQISENYLNGNYGGVYLTSSGNNTISNNQITENDNNGVDLYGSDSNILDRNNISANIGYGVYFSGSSINNITNNTLNYQTSHWDASGIYLDDSSNNNTIKNNSMSDNRYGFQLWDSSNDNQVIYNTIYNTEANNFGSCPLLYTWNGSGYDFVADLFGRGIIGYKLPDGSYRKAAFPNDYAKINANQLQEDGGFYNMKLTEEYDELSYLDQLSLMTVDHSPNVDVFTGTLVKTDYSKVFTANKTPSAPVSCIDQDGNDCLSAISSIDRTYSSATKDQNATLEMNLGNLSGAHQIKLILNGFSIYGQATFNRFVQVKDAEGQWISIYSLPQLNVPDGFPRTYVMNLTGKFPTDDYSVRILFGTARYDYVAVDTTDEQEVTLNTIDPTSSDLHYRGYSITSDGPLPYPDYYSVTNDTQFTSQSGNFTKFGDVTELITATDDKFVIMHHGDEMSVSFPASSVPMGMERDFLIYSFGYFKEHPFATGSKVDPLPFSNMSNYPYPKTEHYPNDVDHQTYRATYNTRNYSATYRYGGSLPSTSGNNVSYNLIIGSTSSLAIHLLDESNTFITYNNISNVSEGMLIDSSSEIQIIGNNLHDIENVGIYLSSTETSTINDNTIYNLGDHGIILLNSNNNNLSNDVVYNGTDAGVYQEGSDNIIYNGMLFYDDLYGFSFSTSDTTITIKNSQTYSIGEYQIGVDVGGSSINLNISNFTAGTTLNSTKFSLFDEVTDGFILNRGSLPGTLPVGLDSFQNNFLTFDISPADEVLDSQIDSLTFHWTDDDAIGFSESLIGAYVWNDPTFELVPDQTLDQASNKLEISDFATDDAPLVVGLLASSPSTPPESGGGGSIPTFNTKQEIKCPAMVKVTTTRGFESVNGVSVRLVETDPIVKEIDTQITSSDGTVTFNLPTLGKYTIYSTKDGYNSIDNELSITYTLDSCQTTTPSIPPSIPTTPPTNQPNQPTTPTQPETPSIPAEPLISAPSNGDVGGTVPLIVSNCPDCTITVTAPDGSTTNVVPDTSGRINFPLDKKGTYAVSLIRNGQTLKTLTVDALATATTPSVPNNTTTNPIPTTPAPQSADNTCLFVIIVLALILGAAGYYWYRIRNK